MMQPLERLEGQMNQERRQDLMIYYGVSFYVRVFPHHSFFFVVPYKVFFFFYVVRFFTLGKAGHLP